MTQAELAERVHLRQPAIQKWEGGRRPTLERVGELEKAMGYAGGHVLRLAGFVADADSVRERLEADPLLTPGHKRIVLRAYDGAVEDSASERSRSAKSRPAATRSRRS